MPQAIRAFIIKHHGVDPMAKVDLKPKPRAKKTTPKLSPGKMMPDGTIYLGRYSPVDRDGISLSKTFNVFAAPEDLPRLMDYAAAVRYVANLEKWHGHDGTYCSSDKELYKSIKKGTYNGGWIIPPRELLTGTAPDRPSGFRVGEPVQADNLLDHKNTGSFKGTFTQTVAPAKLSEWYWSSTELRHDPALVWNACFHDGIELWGDKVGTSMSCRPVRLVEVKRPPCENVLLRVRTH